MARGPSFRTRVLLLVLAVGLVPLVVMGAWLSGRTARSGEALLRERLRELLADERSRVERRWVPYRSALLDLVEQPPVLRAVRSANASGSASGTVGADPPAAFRTGFDSLDAAVESVVLRDAGGRALWRLERPGGSPLVFGQPLVVELPIYEIVSGEEIGALEAAIHFNALRGPEGSGTALGALVTAVDPESGVELLPVPVDPLALDSARFQWRDEAWLVERLNVTEPEVVLRAAAPLAPFAAPLRATARDGLWIMVVVVGAGLLAALALTRRLTGSLEHLSDAATAVAAGDLDRAVEVPGDDEISRLAAAFNTMTENLRRTLGQLAERESLAAVNEFAAALAHEVRNPLTAIRLDLQEVEERLPDDSPLRPLQAQALDDIRRLDRTVGAALETARSAHVHTRPIDLREPVRAAIRGATPSLAEAEADLEPPDLQYPVEVVGDPDALERVFLNLLLNAAEAVEPGGRVAVRVTEEDDEVRVEVRDDGAGLNPDELAQVFDPFYTTRAGGTGVGLPVARRIVTAHRGEIAIDSEPGRGTRVEVTLPRNETFRSA